MQYEDRDGDRWITLTGELDQADVLGMKSAYDEAVESTQGDVIVDMGGVTFIGTLGIGLFLATHEKLTGEGRHLKLANVSEAVESSLELMQLASLFERA